MTELPSDEDLKLITSEVGLDGLWNLFLFSQKLKAAFLRALYAFACKMLLNSTKVISRGVSIKHPGLQSWLEYLTAGESVVQLRNVTLSVLKETLTSHSVQSDKVHECSEAQSARFSDEERLLIYHISSANMAQRDEKHANVCFLSTYSTSLFLNCYSYSSNSCASRACLPAASACRSSWCSRRTNCRSLMNFRRHRARHRPRFAAWTRAVGWMMDWSCNNFVVADADPSCWNYSTSLRNDGH